MDKLVNELDWEGLKVSIPLQLPSHAESVIQRSLVDVILDFVVGRVWCNLRRPSVHNDIIGNSGSSDCNGPIIARIGILVRKPTE